MVKIIEGNLLVFIKKYQPFKKGDLVKVFKGTGVLRNCLLVKQCNGFNRNVEDLGFRKSVLIINKKYEE